MRYHDLAITLAVRVLPADASDDETLAAAEHIDTWLKPADPENPDQSEEDVLLRRARAFSKAIQEVVGMAPGYTLDDVLNEAERHFQSDS